MKRFQKLQRIIKQTTPITTLSWRFLTAKSGSSAYLHRYVFFRQNNSHPITVRVLAALYAYLRWYFFGALCSCWHGMKLHDKYLQNHSEYTSNKANQFFQFLRLCYGYAIPAECYFELSLYKQPAKNWLDYVYDFQAGCWHSAFINFNNARQNNNLRLLRDKYRFEQLLRKNELPTVQTLVQLDFNQGLTQSELNTLPQQFFIKPNTANRSAGCWKVRQIPTNSKNEDNKKQNPRKAELRMENLAEMAVWSKVSLQQFNTLVKQQIYLIQKAEQNPTNLAKLTGDKLAAIRIVTFCQNQVINLMSAHIFLPPTEQLPWGVTFYVDVNNGACQARFNYHDSVKSKIKEVESALNNCTTEQWPLIKQSCLAAHTLLPNLLSVGWDVALTNQGHLILEGNSHWGTDMHQITDREPMLLSKMGKYYFDQVP